MSQDAMIWAIKDAPTADPYEHSVLTVMGDEADESGCGAFPSHKTIAGRARMSERQVRDVLDQLQDRRLIGYGDQTLAHRIRGDRRPVVYDLLIPTSAFANLRRVNSNRVEKNQEPLLDGPCDDGCAYRNGKTDQPRCPHRPDIPDAPPKRRRADHGTKRDKADGRHIVPAVEAHDRTAMPAVHGRNSIPPGLISPDGRNTKSIDVDESPQVSEGVSVLRPAQCADDPFNPKELTPSPLPPAETATPSNQDQEGGGEMASPDSQPTPTALIADDLIDRALALAPHWPRSALVDVLSHEDVLHRARMNPEAVERAVLDLATGEKYGFTKHPNRILSAGHQWWTDSFNPNSRGAAQAATPRAARRPCPRHVGQLADNCGLCRADSLAADTPPTRSPRTPTPRGATRARPTDQHPTGTPVGAHP